MGLGDIFKGLVHQNPKTGQASVGQKPTSSAGHNLVDPQTAINNFASSFWQHIHSAEGNLDAFLLAKTLQDLANDFATNGRYTKPLDIPGFPQDPSTAAHQAAAIRKVTCDIVYSQGVAGIRRATTSRAGSKLNVLTQPLSNKGNKQLFAIAASTNIADESYSYRGPKAEIGTSAGLRSIEGLYKYSLAIIADNYITAVNAGNAYTLFSGNTPQEHLAKLSIMYNMVNHGALDPKSPRDNRLASFIRGCGQYAVTSGESSFYAVARSALTDRKDVRALGPALALTYNDDIERKNHAFQAIVGTAGRLITSPRESYISFDNPSGQRNTAGGMLVADPLLTAITELGNLTEDKKRSAELAKSIYGSNKNPELVTKLAPLRSQDDDGKTLGTNRYIDIAAGALNGDNALEEVIKDAVFTGGGYIIPTIGTAIERNAPPRLQFLGWDTIYKSGVKMITSPIKWAQKIFGD